MRKQNTAFTFRLPQEELAVLEQVASNAGLSVSEYLRKSAALRPLNSVLTKPQIRVSIGTPYAQYGTKTAWKSPTRFTEFRITYNGMHFA